MYQQYTNFREYVRMQGRTPFDERELALVDRVTTTGFWRFKKTTTLTISVYRDLCQTYWRGLNTGEFTRGHQVEDLASAYKAQNNLRP